MKLLPRREPLIAITLTSASAVVAILWITSYWYSLALGFVRSRENGHMRQETFWGVYVQAGQVGVGRSRSHHDFSRWKHIVYPNWIVEQALILKAHGPVGSGSPWMSWKGTSSTQTILERAGFEVVNSTTTPGLATVYSDRALLVPWWAVFLVTLTTTVRWTFFRERRLLWRKRNRCAACGYDLRESRDRCPECGLEMRSSGDGAAGARACTRV